MSGEGGTSCEVELVSCSLSELSTCLCLHASSTEEGSSRRKRISYHLSDIPSEDVFLSAKRASLTHKPTLIDRLIYRNRTALNMGPKKARGGASNVGVKRKRETEPSSSETPSKKLRADAPAGAEARKKPGRKTGFKLDPLGLRNLKKKFNNEPGTNSRYSTRISHNKVRIPFSLRSGRKMADKKKTKKASEKDSNSNVCSSDANGVKSEEESSAKKESISPLKKDPSGVKKSTPIKKDNSGPAKTQLPSNVSSGRKSENISDAGGSITAEKTSTPNEGEMKKKRRKRKRCSMWVRKFKKNVEKKEPETQEEAEDSSHDDDEDDTGRASDVSMLSTTTQDSSTVVAPASMCKDENPVFDDTVAHSSGTVEKEIRPIVSDGFPPMKAEEVLEEKEFKLEKVDVLQEDVDVEELKAVVSKSEVADIKGVEEDRMVVPDSIDDCSDDSATSASSESSVDDFKGDCEIAILKDPAENSTLKKEEMLSMAPVEVRTYYEQNIPPIVQTPIPVETVGVKEVSKSIQERVDVVETDPHVRSPESCDKPTPRTLQVDSEEKDSGLPPMTDLKEAKSLPKNVESTNSCKSSCDNIIIAKCESLANTPLEKTVLENSVLADDDDAVKPEMSESGDTSKLTKEIEKTVSCVERNNVPESVPSTVEKKEIILEDGGPDNDSELKRDADSTTCDNPRELDDSFGDLSLYVSEDDLTHFKDQDEDLPDSTNLAQAEVPSGSEDTTFEPPLPDVATVKAETLTDQFIGPLKIEKEETVENLTEEQKQMKESVLQALGLKSLSSSSNEVPEEKAPKRSDGYTGTLKAVIKLNRSGDKKHMVYKRSDEDLASSNKLEYRICSEMPPDGKHEDENKDSAPEPCLVTEGDEPNDDGTGKESNLIIPEKSSSFSIHPGRLCSDVCSYCFGKFGSLDTPCHVAQLKGEERQRKILENEPHLTGESCLCDACYRYVDRKANFPEKLKVGRLKPPAQPSVCCVTHCTEPATRTIKRKWLIKLKKNITNKLNIDVEKLGHGVYYPLCTQHHYWVEYFTVCGICRKRLNRNNLFSLGAEADRLNLMLAEDGIPARLSVNLFLCKLCRYYADLRLKYPDPTAIPSSNQNFYKNYRRKILLSLDLPVSDSDDELLQPQEDPKKKLEGSHDDSKTDEDMMSLTGLASLLGEQPQQQARIQVKFGNVNIGTLSNLNIGQQGGSAASSATTSAGSPSVSTAHSGTNVNGASSNHKNEPTYPEVSLVANFEYQGPNTPDGSWERYQSTLQFDKKTKQLWTELQRPYGSQTSFLRHLVMLERVWRDGYLVLASDADEAASRYITSARNRIKAFETQGPKMQTSTPSVTTAPPAPVISTPPSTCAAPVSRPPPMVVGRKPQTSAQSFPFLTNTGEIEVTPIRTTKPSPSVQHTAMTSKAPVFQQRAMPAASFQRNAGAQQFPIHLQQQQHVQQHQQMFNQQINPPRKITPLDRAKSLVRMAPLYQQIQQHTQGSGERRGGGGGSAAVRFMGTHSSIPPLVRLPQTQPTQFYQQPHQMYHPTQQQIQQHINQQQSYFQSQPPPQQRVALPKLPRNLTVMSMPARPSLPQAITLSHAGITIEKQTAPSRAPTLPMERPSISVFREPATP